MGIYDYNDEEIELQREIDEMETEVVILRDKLESLEREKRNIRNKMEKIKNNLLEKNKLWKGVCFRKYI